MALKNKKTIILISGILILFLIYFAIQVPLCHDEWKWGSQMRWELFKKGFPNYNGRYLGNLIVVFAVRSNLIKVLIIILCIFSTIWLILKNVDQNIDVKYKNILYLIIIFMVLTIPQSLFRQSYAWLAALVNFAPPAILILIYFKMIDGVFRDDKPIYSKSQCIIAVILGVSTQLFSEHTTIFLVGLSFVIMVYTSIKHKKIYLFHILYFLAAVLGAIIMFSNEAYWSMTDETYKQVTTTAMDLINVYIDKMSDFLFLNNWVLNIFITTNLTILVIKKPIDKTKKRFINAIALLISIFCSVVSTVEKFSSEWVIFHNERINSIVYSVLSIAFFISILTLILMNIEDKYSKYNISLYYISGIAVAIPLLAAAPIGARCFYASYMFMLLAGVRITACNFEKFHPNIDYKQLNIVGICVILSVMFFYANMFRSIGKVDRYRQNIIKEEVLAGAEIIQIPNLPYGDYIWLTTPPDESWEKYYKEYYNIPQETQLIFY